MVVKHCEQDQCLSKSNLEGWNNLPQYRLPSTVALFLSSFHFRLLSRSPQLPLSTSHNFEFFYPVCFIEELSVHTFLKTEVPVGNLDTHYAGMLMMDTMIGHHSLNKTEQKCSILSSFFVFFVSMQNLHATILFQYEKVVQPP